MKDSDAFVILLAVWALHHTIEPARAAARRVKQVQDASKQFGARVYDVLHNDAGHKQDLPGKQLTRQAVLQIATDTGFPNPKLASAIAFAESGGVPGAIVRSSREYSIGLWQINARAHRQYDTRMLKDPYLNARAAFEISKGGTDWTPWTTYKNGKYRQFQTGIFS